MLQCTTLQKAAQKPMVSFHRQGGLRYVAVCCQGQQQPGKSCQKSARKSRAATRHTYLCCALMMRKNKARSGLIGSILSMEISACTTEGELPVHSDKLYEETPISQQPQDYMTAWTTLSTFFICLRGFTEQTWNFESLYAINKVRIPHSVSLINAKCRGCNFYYIQTSWCFPFKF